MNGFTDIRLYLKPQELDAPLRGIARPAPSGLSRWALWRHRWMTRQHLLALSTEQLADVGLTAEDQRQEGLKPFWRG